MAATTRLKLFYLLRLSKPAHDRPIYQAIHDGKIQRILELGIGPGERTLRMIELAAQNRPADQLEYLGIDDFEGRTPADGPGLTLKEAHRAFRATGARIRLLPGDSHAVLSRNANSLGKFDLLVISAGYHPEAMARAWYFVPRMLHEGSLTFVQDTGKGDGVRLLNPRQVGELAESARPRRAA